MGVRGIGAAVRVLLTIERYRELTGPTSSIVDLLAMPEGAESEFDPPVAGRIIEPETDFG